MHELEKKVDELILQLKEEIEGISDYIFNNPELGDEEFLSSKYLVDLLAKNGFDLMYPYLGIKTSFRAEYGDDEGPCIAFLAEYDALPGYGEEKKAAHACGHNWIAGSTVGAALVLSKIKETFTGKVVVIGTPAEETTGRKVDLINKGAFHNIDTVFQMHLNENNNLYAKALAMDSWEFRFTGKESYPIQDEPEIKSHAANILSNNLSLSNCTFLAISLSVYLFAFLSNISKVILSFRYIRASGMLLNFS